MFNIEQVPVNGTVSPPEKSELSQNVNCSHGRGRDLLSAYLGGVLEDAGYQVVAAANADEAIEILEARNDIRIVITDINMPGSMDGLRLAAAIGDRWPPIHLIVVTGFTPPSKSELPYDSLFIPKPYGAVEILSAVRHFQ